MVLLLDVRTTHMLLQTKLNIECTSVNYGSNLQTGNNHYCEYIE